MGGVRLPPGTSKKFTWLQPLYLKTVPGFQVSLLLPVSVVEYQECGCGFSCAVVTLRQEDDHVLILCNDFVKVLAKQ